MSDVTRQPPAKKEVALALLEGSSMFVHLDPRRPDVMVPKWFVGQPQLILQVGLNMAIPIPDLKVDDTGITCTLSFNRTPFWCRVPWTAVYALVGEDGRGGLWAEDVPPEIPLQQKARPTKPVTPKRARATLASVPKKPLAKEDVQTREPAEGEVGTDGAMAWETETDGTAEQVKPAKPTSIQAAVQPAAVADPETQPEAEATRANPAVHAPAGKKAKREIPPYLRVIK
jgi:hypothetical protein